MKRVSFSDFPLIKNAKEKRQLVDITFELTARCNNNCNHCYNNLPENDPIAIENELSTMEIKQIVDQAFDLGALRILLTGGEVFLRKDFADLYIYIKKKGFLVSVFTNATRISDDHVRLFKQYPPSHLEATVYGISNESYARITKTNHFDSFMEGIKKLKAGAVPVTFKTIVLKSNIHLLNDIADFCRSLSQSPFRYDPFLTLRTDRDAIKNKKIIQERISEDQIANLEKKDPVRLEAVKTKGITLNQKPVRPYAPGTLFHCGLGKFNCFISYDGFFRLCRPLVNPTCIYDLKKGTLKDAWEVFAPSILALTTEKELYKNKCGTCRLRGLCKWCPAIADLETGILDEYLSSFCSQTRKRYDFCI